jgi:hypothetical protein
VVGSAVLGRRPSKFLTWRYLRSSCGESPFWNAAGVSALDSYVMSVPAVNDVRFAAVSQDDALAEPLLAELAVEYATRYGSTTEAVGAWLREYPADEFAPPDGGMLVGLLDGQPVTGGAFRRFDAETAELKRIWTDGRHRRQGHDASI